MPRVQEYIARSGRVACSQKLYDTIHSALIELKARARIRRLEYRTYDYSVVPETFTDNAHLETDNATYVDVVSNGGARRRFTLVTKRGGEPVPFGHLVEKMPGGQLFPNAKW